MEKVGKIIASCQGLPEKMERLKRKIEALRCQADDLKAEAKDAELRTGKKRKQEVENWFRDEERMKEKVQTIEQEILSSNVCSLLTLGSRIEQLTSEVIELKEQGKFQGGLLLDLCAKRGYPLSTTKLVGQAFEQNLEKIWSCLMDDKVCRIGIYGMGGVGKSTLVSHIHDRLLEKSETSSHVCWITLSQDLSVWKLQNDIAKAFNLKFSNEDERKRAAELSEALIRMKRCVLILDDVWNKISLDRVGIPAKVDECKLTLTTPSLDVCGCKLILTTRSLDVCRWIDCQVNIKVEPLSEEEAWNLFTMILGQHTELSPEVRNIAVSVVAKCDGLPIGIKTMAASMRGVNDIHEWRNVLEELKKLTMEHEDMETEVFRILEYSYCRLNDVKLKLCFLYCALYPEDFKIKRNELVRYFIAEGLVDGREPRDAKFDKVHTMLNKLERACMLEGCEDNEGNKSVMMHDLIRDMALKITKVSQPRFMVKAGVGLREIPVEQEWTEDLDKVSLMNNAIQEITWDESPRCPRLVTLILKDNPLIRIADSFFENLQALQVLDLSRTWIKKLPNSISGLENLTALLLEGCNELTDVPPVGKLRELQELDISWTGIREVPEGMDKLVSLRKLNMKQTRNLETFPSGTLGRLSHLQEVAFDCKSAFVEEIAEELEGLKELEEFEVRLFDVQAFNRFVKSPQRCGKRLNRYFIELSGGVKFEDEKNMPMRFGRCIIKKRFELAIQDVKIGNNYRKMVKLGECTMKRKGENKDDILLPCDLEFLEIKDCHFTSGCLTGDFPSLCDNNAIDLKKCTINNCEGLESIFSLSSSSTGSKEECPSFPLFRRLEILHLFDLPDLREVFRSTKIGSGITAAAAAGCTFYGLKELHVAGCHQIKTLFTPGLLQQHLGNLENITVTFCCQMKEVVTINDGVTETSFSSTKNEGHNTTIVLPKLKNFCLSVLPSLENIYKGIMICDSLPEIKVRCCPNLQRLPLSLPNLVDRQQYSAPTAVGGVGRRRLIVPSWSLGA